MKRRFVYLVMLLILAGVLIWSGIHPIKRGLWFYEISPAILLILFLLVTYRRFPLTPLSYFLVFLSSIVMFIGGHYTYGEMPLFNYLKDLFDLSRNHFDRLGHFLKGMVSTVLLREYMIRTHLIRHKKWLLIISIGMSLAISAGYEILEFLAAFVSGANIQDFLGLQGDIWDSLWDMIMALSGAILILFLSKWHDQQIQSIKRSKKR